ncbi:MAG TPA: hypothetical protein VH518_07205 [Tepidisphaeraceae bacterium]|jgi:hypothetical protein
MLGGAIMTLDYRSPTTPQHRVQRVMIELERTEMAALTKLTMKVIIGGLLCLVGPIFVAIILKSIDARWRLHRLPPFWIFVVMLAIVVVPLLLWLERRTRGEFVSRAIEGEANPLNASSYGEFSMQSTKLLWIFYTEVALAGPRLIWEAIDGLQSRTRGDDQVTYLAAQIVVELFDAGQGVDRRTLLRPDRSGAEIVPALRLLESREWVDLSRRRDRVWLTTPARERLSRIWRDS